MLETLRDLAVRKTFGGGMQGALAEKGIDWLGDEIRSAIAHEPESIDNVRLRPGDTYTVVARPPYTRSQRRLADKVDSLTATEAKLSRATGRQRKAARRLARSQKRLDRRRPGTRRHRRAAAREQERARRFDRVMAPSKKLLRTRSELTVASRELERSKARSLAAARRGRRDGGRTEVHR